MYMYYLLKIMENQTCYVSLVQVRIENLWKLKTFTKVPSWDTKKKHTKYKTIQMLGFAGVFPRFGVWQVDSPKSHPWETLPSGQPHQSCPIRLEQSKLRSKLKENLVTKVLQQAGLNPKFGEKCESVKHHVQRNNSYSEANCLGKESRDSSIFRPLSGYNEAWCKHVLGQAVSADLKIYGKSALEGRSLRRNWTSKLPHTPRYNVQVVYGSQLLRHTVDGWNPAPVR